MWFGVILLNAGLRQGLADFRLCPVQRVQEGETLHFISLPFSVVIVFSALTLIGILLLVGCLDRPRHYQRA
jgi:hypothetical protein